MLILDTATCDAKCALRLRFGKQQKSKDLDSEVASYLRQQH